MKQPILVAALAVVVVLLGWWYSSRISNCCESAKFSAFYGVSESDIHFRSLKGESDLSDEGLFFDQHLPLGWRNQLSFVVLGRRGGGKTLLRMMRTKSTQPDELMISFLGPTLRGDLRRFFGESTTLPWTSERFANSILIHMLEEILGRYKPVHKYESVIKPIDIIDIAALYYHEDIAQLRTFVNDLLGCDEGWRSKCYFKETMVLSSAEEQAEFGRVLMDITADMEAVHGAQHAQSRNGKAAAQLLSYIHVLRGIAYDAIAKRPFESISRFVDFVRAHTTFGYRHFTVVVDALDELDFFFHQENVRKDNLETFINASLADGIVNLYLADKLRIAYFYPQVPGLRVSVARPDKLPLIPLTWHTRTLVAYGEHLVSHMRRHASLWRCRTLPTFERLVGMPETADIIAKLRHPRELHIFMQRLLPTICAGKESECVASRQDAEHAYEVAMHTMIERNELEQWSENY